MVREHIYFNFLSWKKTPIFLRVGTFIPGQSIYSINCNFWLVFQLLLISSFQCWNLNFKTWNFYIDVSRKLSSFFKKCCLMIIMIRLSLICHSKSSFCSRPDLKSQKFSIVNVWSLLTEMAKPRIFALTIFESEKRRKRENEKKKRYSLYRDIGPWDILIRVVQGLCWHDLVDCLVWPMSSHYEELEDFHHLSMKPPFTD